MMVMVAVIAIAAVVNARSAAADDDKLLLQDQQGQGPLVSADAAGSIPNESEADDKSVDGRHWHRRPGHGYGGYGGYGNYYTYLVGNVYCNINNILYI